MAVERLFIHPSEVASLEGVTDRTALRRLKRIKHEGMVTLDEYAKSRKISAELLVERLKLKKSPFR